MIDYYYQDPYNNYNELHCECCGEHSDVCECAYLSEEKRQQMRKERVSEIARAIEEDRFYRQSWDDSADWLCNNTI